MNGFLRKSISVLLILSSLLSSTALAEKVLVMSDAAVYAAAGDSASEIGTLSAGTVLTRKASHNGWAMVTMNGKTAYMKNDALAVPKACKKIAYANQETVLYKSFSTDSKKVATVEAGAQLKVAGVAGDWAYAMVGKQTGFVLTGALTLEAPKQESGNSSAVETMSITAYAATDGAKVYSTSGKKLGQVALNTAVTVKAIRDNLCLVERDGVTAVMYKSDLATEKVEKVEDTVETKPEEKVEPNITTISPTTFYVKADGAKVYAASGETIATLTKNFAVTVSAYSGDYAFVSCDGNSGLMRKDDLTAEKAQEVEEAPTTLGYGSTGEAVEKVQTRLKELGYFGGSVGGNYLDLTQSAVKAFQKAAGLTESGEVDAKTLSAMFADDAPKYEAPKPTGSSTAVAATGTAVEMDWWTSDIQSIFSRGTTATITDVDTGIAWHETRSGGTNHADVQPTTAADTAAMKKAVGSWSWTRRAIFVTINGKNYAASMNCMPHGSGSIKDNDFNGHHCIHFTNSRTHGTNKVCSLHQNAIKKALKASL